MTKIKWHLCLLALQVITTKAEKQIFFTSEEHSISSYIDIEAYEKNLAFIKSKFEQSRNPNVLRNLACKNCSNSDIAIFQNVNSLSKSAELEIKLTQRNLVATLDALGISASELERRAFFDIIGDSLHYVIGTAGPTQLKKINKNFEILKRVNEETSKMQNKIISTEDSMHRIIENHEKELFNILSDQKAFENELHYVILLMTLSSSTRRLNDNINEVAKIQEKCQQQKLSPFVIDLKTLENKIMEIHLNESYRSPIFPYHRSEEYFKHKLTQCNLKKTHLEITLFIPIIDFRDKFKIKKCSDTFEMCAVSSTGNFRYIKEKELDMCLELENSFFCKRRGVINYGEPKSDPSIYDIGPEDFLIIIPNNKTINLEISCPKNTTKLELKSNHRSKIPAKCRAKAEYFKVDTIQEITDTEIAAFEIPSIVEITDMNEHVLKNDYETQMKEHAEKMKILEKQAEEIKHAKKIANENSDSIKDVEVHTKNHYYIYGSALLAIILIFMAFYFHNNQKFVLK